MAISFIGLDRDFPRRRLDQGQRAAARRQFDLSLIVGAIILAGALVLMLTTAYPGAHSGAPTVVHVKAGQPAQVVAKAISMI